MSDGQFQRTGSLNKPPQVLLTAVSQVRSSCTMGEQSIKRDILNALEKHPEMREQFSRPQHDWLFHATYCHQGNEPECSACDQGQLVTRSPRAVDDPQIHYGLIASGNQVMKDAQTRDLIAQELDILCFEMEAAGLMDLLPFLVIRGICVYCDSHKHKQWQRYAALAAAAYAKSLLSILPIVTNKSQLEQKIEFTVEEKACLQGLFLTNPVDDKNALKRRKGDRAAGTCEWILKTDKLTHWLDPPESTGQIGSDILCLCGNPGTGKSTMVITMTDELPKQPSFANGNKTFAYFFCDSSSENQRTAVAILRGLLYLLVKQCPMLIKHLVSKYVERRETLYMSFDALWTVFMEMARDPSCEIYCIIDALDECEPESQQILLGQIHQSFQGGREKSSLTSNPHILITSRPYPEISEYLSHFNHKDLASYGAVRADLQAMIQEKVKNLAERKRYSERVTSEISKILEEKAEGTSLWVGIACDELKRVQSRNAVRTLEKLPPGLYALYQQLLNTALANNDEDMEIIVDMLRLVAFARRPLTIPELSALCPLYPDYDEDSRLQFTKELIDLCRLMIVIQDERVRLLHKSVKDFLVKERHEIDDLKVHADLANRCIDNLLDCGAITKERRLKGAVLEYAVEYWPAHASLADTEFAISPGYESFFEPTSKEWKQWLEMYNSLPDQFQELEEGFCAFHIAARWGIMPLISWFLGTTTERLGLPYTSDERTYNDAEFTTINALTPLQEAARQGHTTVMDILLKKMRVGVGISEQVVIEAAETWDNETQVMTFLLDHWEDQIQITEGVIKAAARNHRCGKEIITLLVNHQGDQIQIIEGVIKAAAGNNGCGKEIITLLLNQQDQIQITEDIIQAAAGNNMYGEEIITLLLDYQGDQIQITEDMIIAAARKGEKNTMILLLDCWGDQIQITEDIIKAAAENYHYGRDIMTLLLDCWADQIQITKNVVKAAAGNSRGGEGYTELLLQLEDQIKGGENQLQMSCWDGNMSNVKHLLATGSNTNIINRCGWTPLHAACWNGHIEIVKLLLAHGASVKSISNTGWSPLDAAFTHSHIDVIRTLLQKHTGNIEGFNPICFSDNHKSELLDLDHDKLGVRYVGTKEEGFRG